MSTHDTTPVQIGHSHSTRTSNKTRWVHPDGRTVICGDLDHAGFVRKQIRHRGSDDPNFGTIADQIRAAGTEDRGLGLVMMAGWGRVVADDAAQELTIEAAAVEVACDVYRVLARTMSSHFVRVRIVRLMNFDLHVVGEWRLSEIERARFVCRGDIPGSGWNTPYFTQYRTLGRSAA